MANKLTTVGFKVTDHGSIAQTTKEAKQLRTELEKIEKGASIGKKLAMAKPAAVAAVEKAENTEYGRARGAMGGTGASARDFANQAQGLGGLVRIYATWAANIFAVSAAFNALREAANTDSMIKSMNQLSASSGVAMGTLAKQFADASGGAISLREAMEATTKAMSSGMSQSQFMKLGEVANKASKALGINMSDAVSRLTRGITKLEPELIDELGIFAKVGKSTEDYAKQMGKAVSAVTDFEKRQAYANAVLDEGNKKFGEINLEANPYDQLAASLKNLTQEILSGANKVLGPLIGMLSSSPTALIIAVGGLTTMLLKQAMPAIGQYKQELADSADFAKKRYEARAEEVRQIEVSRMAWMTQQVEQGAEAEVKALDAATEEIAKTREAKFRKGSKAYEILNKAAQEVTNNDIEHLKALESRYAKAGKFELAAKYNDARLSLERLIEKEKEYQAVAARIEAQAKEPGKFGSTKWTAERAAKKAENRSTSLATISKASSDTQIYGVSAAVGRLNKTVSDSKLPMLNKMFTLVGGGAAIATTGVTGFLSAISGAMVWLGVITGALALLNGILSKNSDQMADFNTTVDSSKESIKTATAVQEKYNNTLSTESITAKANALDGVAMAMENTAKTGEKAIAAMSGWDKLVDGIKDAFGYGVRDAMAENLSQQVVSALSVIDDPKLRKQAEERFKQLFGISELTQDNIAAAIKASKDTTKVSTEAAKSIKPIVVAASAASAALRSVGEAIQDTQNAYQELSNTLNVSDPIVKYGQAMYKQGFVMQEAFKDTRVAAAALQDIMEDVSKLRAFPESSRVELLDASKAYANVKGSISDYTDEVTRLEAELARLNSINVHNLWADQKGALIREKRAVRDALVEANAEREKALKRSDEVLKQTMKSLATIAEQSISNGFAIAIEKAKTASATATIDFQKAALGYLPDSIEKIKAMENLDLRKIDLQIQEIQQTERLIDRFDELIATEKLKSLEKEREKSSEWQQSGRTTAQVDDDIRNTRAYIADLQKTKINQQRPEASGLTQEQMNLQMRRQSTASKISSLMSQRDQVVLQSYIAQITADQRKDLKMAKDREAARKRELSTYIESPEYLGMSPSEQLEQVRQRNFSPASMSDQLFIDTFEASLEEILVRAIMASKVADSQTKAGAERQLVFSNANLETARTSWVENTSLRSMQDFVQIDKSKSKEEYDLEIKRIEGIEKRAEAEEAASEASLNYNVQALEQKRDILAISDEQYNSQSVSFKLQEAGLAREKELQKANISVLKAEAKYKADVAANGGNVTKAMEDERIAAITNANIEIANAKLKYDNTVKQIELQVELNERTKYYGETMTKTFEGLADAMIDFVKTGKFEFKDLINSMLEDLARFELQRSLRNAWQSSGGMEGIAKMIGGFLSPGSSSGNVSDTTETFGDLAPDAAAAKGVAYDYGVQKFAKGGTFTNSVVSSPTYFKFAKGTGLMGEAGPEAIMPLRRDSNGSLGVKATMAMPKVDVVVNNNSNANATAQETVDSRGNRRVEVTIGEMVASEMGRPNSSVRNAMVNNFGTAPRLIRR